MSKDNISRIDTDNSNFPEIIPHVERVSDFLKFAQWYSTPRDLREQKTQKDFARAIRIDEDTLTTWKHHQYFWPLAQQFMSELMRERIPDVIEGLYNAACGEGKAREVEAFLKIAGMGIDPKNNKKLLSK